MAADPLPIPSAGLARPHPRPRSLAQAHGGRTVQASFAWLRGARGFSLGSLPSPPSSPGPGSRPGQALPRQSALLHGARLPRAAPFRAGMTGRAALARMARWQAKPWYASPLSLGPMALQWQLRRDLFQRPVDPRRQLWRNRPVRHIARGRLVGRDHARGLIHPQVRFAPRAASGDPMPANFPFALAEHLQPRAVQHRMNRARSTGGSRYLQPGRPTARRGVMRNSIDGDSCPDVPAPEPRPRRVIPSCADPNPRHARA